MESPGREVKGAEILPRHLLLVARHACAPRRALPAITEPTHINLQLAQGSAQSVSVHSQLPRRAALVALVLFENRGDKASFKLAHSF